MDTSASPQAVIFAASCAAAMGSSGAFGPGCVSEWAHAVGGVLLTAHGENGTVRVPIHISIPPNWLEMPPVVTGFATFLRQETDWHASKSSLPLPWATEICYVLDLEWLTFFAEITRVDLDSTACVKLATLWLLNNVNSLLSRHLIAWRYHLKAWPIAWPAWKHRRAGQHQFDKERPSASWKIQMRKMDESRRQPVTSTKILSNALLA